MIKTAAGKLAVCVAVAVFVLAAVLAAEAIFLGTSVDPFELLHNGSLNDTGAAGLVILLFLAIPTVIFYACVLVCGGLAAIYVFTALGLALAIWKCDERRIYRFNVCNAVTSGLFALTFGWIVIGLLRIEETSFELTVATALLAAAAAVAVILCVLSIVCAGYLKKQMNAQIMV